MDQGLLRSRKGGLTSGGRVIQLLLAASLALNLYLLFFRGAAPTPDADGTGGLPVAAEDGTPLADGPEVGVDLAPSVPVATYKHLTLKVRGSIAQTFGQALGTDEGDLVSAFYSRIFMWPLDLKSDVRKDDELTLLYSIAEDGQVDIPAASYKSLKNRTTYTAYHFQQDGRAWPHYYDSGGVEVALRLEDGPLDAYEQVTSLLKDRPSHKGVDFKVPVGRPVKSPFRGEITRTNWARKYNGNCVEVRYSDGMIGKFLHLDKLRSGIVPGRVVAPGEELADSGNTGRSTAPHLHYQLEKSNGRVIDPFELHETHRLTLGDADMKRFDALVSALDAQLSGEAAPLGASAEDAKPAPVQKAVEPAASEGE